MEEVKYFPINLQLFADDGNGEKTEKATPRRREEARKKGQVFKSTDLNSAVILIAGCVAVFASFPYITANMESFTELFLLDRGLHHFDNAYVLSLLGEVLWVLAKLTLPILITTFVAALGITYLQVGFVFSGESLTPKLERINPAEGFKRVFSRRALVELVKSLLKVVVTGYIVYSVILKNIYILPRLVDIELATVLKTMGNIVIEMSLKVAVVFLLIGVLDYLFQWYEHEKSLKMSKYDIKQEYKQIEGDPLVKSRQKQIQREAAMRRMMAAVPDADVVITNPTHFAVVLKYQADLMEAPKMVAKGQDFLALKIKEIAAENQVGIVENPPLARTLYESINIGDLIPEEFYQAVAEVLAFVYKQKGKSKH